MCGGACDTICFAWNRDEWYAESCCQSQQQDGIQHQALTKRLGIECVTTKRFVSPSSRILTPTRAARAALSSGTRLLPVLCMVSARTRPKSSFVPIASFCTSLSPSLLPVPNHFPKPLAGKIR